MPCTDSSTICERRHVTTDPDDRRTIRKRRLPSSFDTSRTRKPSRDTHTSNPTTQLWQISVRDQPGEVVDLQGEGCLPRH
jgi:hypothetical protein